MGTACIPVLNRIVLYLVICSLSNPPPPSLEFKLQCKGLIFPSYWIPVRICEIKTHQQISGKCPFQPNLILALEQSWNTTQSGLKTKLFYLCHLFSLMKACDTADKYLNAFWSIQISFNIFNLWHLVSCPLIKITWEQKLFRRRTFQQLYLPNYASS